MAASSNKQYFSVYWRKDRLEKLDALIDEIRQHADWEDLSRNEFCLVLLEMALDAREDLDLDAIKSTVSERAELRAQLLQAIKKLKK